MSDDARPRRDSPDVLGDMDAEEFRRQGHRAIDWIADYLADVERYPVLAKVRPRELADALPPSAPARGEPFDVIFRDFERLIVPAATHWNHPGFFAYFAISSSGPGILGELLSAALNQQAMLWRTSPAATELEAVTLTWLRRLLGLPDGFEGVIYDTASIASLHALAAARQAAIPAVRTDGLPSAAPRLLVYCSEHAHSSIDKAVILLGLGHHALRKIPVDESFRLRPAALAAAIAADRADGGRPLAVVATVGTTSTTSVDPVREIQEICEREGAWLHVDAAYAGAAALIPATRTLLADCGRADSIVVNPHKWLFTPFDLSAFYCRRMDVVREAFSLVPDYLQTTETEPVRNLMDTGIQLGRRFRALKLWMILRYFGADGLGARLQEHVRLAGLFAGWVDDHRDFERLAPVPFSVVCFRYHPAHGGDEDALDRLNERLLDAVNASGDVFLSHTRLRGRFAMRLAVGHIKTEERHVRRAWDVVLEAARALS